MSRTNSAATKWFVLAVLAFAALAIAVEARGVLPGDAALYRFARRLRHAPMVVTVGEALAGRAIEIVFASAALALILMLIVRGEARTAAFVVLSLVPAVLTPILKDILHRQPPAPLPSMSGSFPSGHAVGSMTVAAVAVALVAGTRWRGLALSSAAIFVAAVGISATMYGDHWPSDVLAGWIVAPAWTFLMYVLVRPPRTNGRRKPARSLRPPTP